MDLIAITSELMPKGNPDFSGVRKYPTIQKLQEELGRKKTLLVLLLLVRDFCNSLNVVRNMTEDQMIETASMLLDECDNFRLEDYVMMFSLAKRGQLVKVMDRVDIELVGKMLDEYWQTRNQAGRRLQEEAEKEYERKLLELSRQKTTLTSEEEQRHEKWFGEFKKLTDGMINQVSEEKQEDENERQKRISRIRENFGMRYTPEQINEMNKIKSNKQQPEQ